MKSSAPARIAVTALVTSASDDSRITGIASPRARSSWSSARPDMSGSRASAMMHEGTLRGSAERSSRAEWNVSVTAPSAPSSFFTLRCTDGSGSTR